MKSPFLFFSVLLGVLLGSALHCHFLSYKSDYGTVRIAVVGDVMCHQPQITGAYDKDCDCYDFRYTFAPVKKYLERADLSISNLETTLPGKRELYGGYPRFGAPDALVEALSWSGIDILTLSNNHILDRGRQAFLRSIKVVHENGMYSLGAYASEDDWRKRRILLLRRNGLRLAFLSYTYATNGFPTFRGTKLNRMHKRNIAADLKVAHTLAADAVIVLYHFGKEYQRKPTERQQAYTNFAFYHGADIVLGSHPHVLQPLRFLYLRDIYGRMRKRFVAYSLGNFLSSQRWRYVDGGAILYFDISRIKTHSKEAASLAIRNVHYEPIWVYVKDKHRHKLKNNRKVYSYFILPINEYLSNTKERLPPRARRNMWRSLRDTKQAITPILGRKVAPILRPANTEGRSK